MTSPLKALGIEPVFLLTDEALLAAAAVVCPEMSTCLTAWRSTLPLPRQVRDTRAGRWRRFPESYRSLAWLFGELESCKASLLVKGSEPTMQDFDELVRWVSRSPFRSEPTFGHMPMADHLALREHKVPGALTLREALAETKTALTLQQAHLEHYQSLLPMPLPLLVHRLDRETSAMVRASARAHLTRLAFERVQGSIDEGLALYVYFYPGAPLRVRQAAGPLGNEGEPERAARLARGGAEQAIDRWLQTTARLWHLGFTLYSYQNEGLGACFDPGNACLDGGFLDVDSVVPLAELKDDGMFYDALVATVLGLTRTALHLLPRVCHPETAELLARQYIMRRLSHFLASEARPALELDPRFKLALGGCSMAELGALLCSRVRETRCFLDMEY